MSAPLLSIEDLRTYFYSRAKRAFIRSVDGVNLEVNRGETLGVVGESGSGKSITALSVMGLVPAEPGVVTGRIRLKTDRIDKNLLDDLDNHVELGRRRGRIMEVAKNETAWRENVERIMASVRGPEIAMIFQNPKSALNPYSPVGRQISESIRLHTNYRGKAEARERALYWLERVKIDSPGLRYDNYPYGLSGGMCQRAMIAMALSSEPALLIADEPTTGLDATIQARIVDLLAELKRELGITTLLISHDIGVIQRLADRISVMYGGTVVESGPARDVLAPDNDIRHPYTAALLASKPSARNIAAKGRLQAIEGEVLDTVNLPAGCRFYGRCNKVTDAIRAQCAGEEPKLSEVAPGHRVRCWLHAK
ncbi:MAG TPA: ABC transporter ATP-binding protein [Acidiferrobacterales bacterium]